MVPRLRSKSRQKRDCRDGDRWGPRVPAFRRDNGGDPERAERLGPEALWYRCDSKPPGREAYGEGCRDSRPSPDGSRPGCRDEREDHGPEPFAAEILANLEKRIESLRGEAELHARQEEHHREQRSRLEAELRKAMEHLESFRLVAATAEELDLPAPAPPPPPPEEDLGPRPTLAKMVARVVAGRPEGDRFGARSVAQEVNRRFRKELPRPLEPPAASVILRRMSTAGRIHQVREGKPNHEALYVKGARPRLVEGEGES